MVPRGWVCPEEQTFGALDYGTHKHVPQLQARVCFEKRAHAAFPVSCCSFAGVGLSPVPAPG